MEGGGPYQQLLSRLFHWLMREPELQEERLSFDENLAGGLTVTVNSLEDEHPDVFNRSGWGEIKETPVEMNRQSAGLFYTDIKYSASGIIDLRMGDQHLQSQDSIFWEETKRLLPDHPAMQKLAALHNGHAISLGSEDPVPDLRYATSAGRVSSSPHASDWLGLRKTDRYSLDGIETKPLLPPAVILLILLISLAGTWWRETAR